MPVLTTLGIYAAGCAGGLGGAYAGASLGARTGVTEVAKELNTLFSAIAGGAVGAGAGAFAGYMALSEPVDAGSANLAEETAIEQIEAANHMVSPSYIYDQDGQAIGIIPG